MASDTTIITDTTVVTVDANDSIHYDAAVAVQGGRIVALGPSQDIVARFVRDGDYRICMLDPGLLHPAAHAISGSQLLGFPGTQRLQ